MSQQFEFRSAIWFRAPLRLVVLAVTVFALMSLYPALRDAANPDHGRALAGMAVLGAFVVLAVVFMVSMNDGLVEVDNNNVTIRFESFFNARFPVEDIAAARPVDPRPRWRYRWGLSTNFRDRVVCSHGGQLVEIELSRPCHVRLWPRTLVVTRFWLGVRDAGAFLDALHRAAANAATDASPPSPMPAPKAA
ncbi:MAG TPA: hypothetical protein VJP07_07525 [Dehalococcoidia bacterium]|nr:hypothetical protein [Dehalococcoidia bacterium]